MAVVLAIALAVVVTVLVVRPAGGGSSGNGDPTQPNSGSEFASADDTGPVNIITEDPTCAAWGRISRNYAEKAQSAGWGDRDYSIPASSWTSQQRAMYETVGTAMSDAADQAGLLVYQTPHRVMRELYQQFIAYIHDFNSSIDDYTVEDDPKAVVVDTLSSLTADICSAIDYGSAPNVGPLVPAGNEPANAPSPTDGPPEVFMTTRNSVCSDWESSALKFDDESRAWRAFDPGVPAKDWPSERRAQTDAVVPTLTESANNVEELGRRSGNGTLDDFASLAAQYARGYTAALPTYTSADNFLYQVNARLVRTINWACKASS